MLAAIAVCAANAEELEGFGAADLMKAAGDSDLSVRSCSRASMTTGGRRLLASLKMHIAARLPADATYSKMQECLDILGLLFSAGTGLQGSSRHVSEEEAEKLWRLQQRFKANVLASRHLMKTARSQLKELLRGAR